VVWNSLPTEFRSLSVGFGDFRDARLRRYCSHDISALRAIVHIIALYKFSILFYSNTVFAAVVVIAWFLAVIFVAVFTVAVTV